MSQTKVTREHLEQSFAKLQGGVDKTVNDKKQTVAIAGGVLALLLLLIFFSLGKRSGRRRPPSSRSGGSDRGATPGSAVTVGPPPAQRPLQGVLGGSKGWLTVFAVMWGTKKVKTTFGKSEEVAATEVLKPGEFVTIRTITPPTRRERKAAKTS